VSTILGQPKLEIKDNRFEFGLIPKGGTVVHFFWFKSAGDDTLIIENIKTGCSCALMPLEQDWIAPGDSMEVGIYWDVKNRINAVGRYPYIFTNANPEPHRLYLTGSVVKTTDSAQPVGISPYRFELSSYSDKSIDSINFVINNFSDKKVILSEVSYPLKECELFLPEFVNAKSKTSGYIKVKDEFIDKKFKSSLTIQINDDKKSRITIPIRRKLY
ncbi:MAG: DUF1573 domain-containing protein, partial [Candidatus Zixiibacteriota bacterium]